MAFLGIRELPVYSDNRHLEWIPDYYRNSLKKKEFLPMGGNEVSDYTYTKFTIKVIVSPPVLSRCPRVRNRRKNPASVHQDAHPNGL